MFLLSSSRAPVVQVLDPNIRSRPVVSGGTLRTDTGQIIRAGAAVTIINGNGAQSVIASTWDDARALGLNCMRVGVRIGTSTLSATLLKIDTAVELARTRRMYVMLGYFEAVPGGWDDSVTANTAAWNTFWGTVAPRYKDSPHVFYEMVNEPTSGGPSWGDVSQFTTAVRDGIRSIFDTMRSGAPNTVILWPSVANLSPSSASVKGLIADMGTRGNGQPVDYTKACWSFHYYGGETSLGTSHFPITSGTATDGGRAGMLNLKASYPLIMTETNWFQDSPPREWLVDALDLLEDIEIGWTLLRRPGQTSPANSAILGPLYLENKIAQLRSRGFSIPVE